MVKQSADAKEADGPGDSPVEGSGSAADAATVGAATEELLVPALEHPATMVTTPRINAHRLYTGISFLGRD
jgi:hypothetical protein